MSMIRKKKIKMNQKIHHPSQHPSEQVSSHAIFGVFFYWSAQHLALDPAYRSRKKNTPFTFSPKKSMSFSTKACCFMVDMAWLPVAALAAIYSGLFKNSDSAVPERNHPAILLLHGSGSNHGTLAMGISILKKTFPGSVFTVQYDGIWLTDRTKNIDDYMAAIREKCEYIRFVTHQNTIYLVGHSMGGLVSARFVQRCADEMNIRVPAVVTIGSPWRGSKLIDTFWSPGKAWTSRHEDMRPNSKFIKSLNRELPRHKTRFYCVGSLTDLLVPFSRSFPEGRDPDHVDNLCINGIGHYSLILYPAVWNFVLHRLQDHISSSDHGGAQR